MSRKITLGDAFFVARKLKKMDLQDEILKTMEEVKEKEITNNTKAGLILFDNILNVVLEEGNEKIFIEITSFLLELDANEVGIGEILEGYKKLAEENNMLAFFRFVSKDILT